MKRSPVPVSDIPAQAGIQYWLFNRGSLSARLRGHDEGFAEDFTPRINSDNAFTGTCTLAACTSDTRQGTIP